MELDFFIAKQKHNMWYLKLKAYLIELQEFSLEQATSYKACDLGKWLYSEGYERFKHFPEMIRLEKIHIELHNTIKEIIELKSNNNIEEAYKKLETLKIISIEIISLLDKLDNQINNVVTTQQQN